MALVLKDRAQQTGTANTTVSFTLSGAVPGFQSLSSIGNGNTTYYVATDVSGNWETGEGTYSTTGPTLTRNTILSSSNSGSAVTFSGTVNVLVTYPAEKSINYDLNGVATIGSTLGYSDTGIIGSFASTVAGYNQVILQNKSSATNASANLNVSNDTSTSSTGFAELGINSSTFSNGPGCFNIPSASYLASAGTDLSIGTYGAYNVHFATNSNTTDSMTIFNDGGISLGGYGNPGLGSLCGNKFVPGLTNITAAAGTTILTSASTYYQKVSGSTTQTIQLPDATTLLVGTTFIIDNDSSGVVTVTDGATTVIDTVQSGSFDWIFLEANGTVAGSWGKYSLLPASYDFNSSTANFGTATLTNGTWNGNTVGTGYGGTGLTTFTAANNAIYSTSSSALAAGTLPIAAGGTSATTANGAFNALAPSQATNSGKYLTTDGTNTSWGTVTQTTFSAGTTGFTPSTPTSGAVTLAGTLNVTNGGTGLTSLTANYIPYGNGTSAYQSSSTFTFNGTTFSSPNINVTSSTVPANGEYLASTNSLAWSTNTTERMRLDASGNLGLGVTPSAWSGDKAIQIGTCGAISGGTGTTTAIYMLSNAYYNSGYKYIANGLPASGYYQYNGGHAWETAPSGSVGTPITFTQAMTLDASGNLSIGSTSNAAKLDVSSTDNLSGTYALRAYSNNRSAYMGMSYGEIYATGGSGISINAAGATAIALTTNGSERMRITALGGISFGNTGTAYGTSGQVLQSNGNAPPTWVTPAASGGVTTISFGSTGLTPSTATSGAVSVAGTLAVANGGTGVTTSTGSGNNVLSTSPTLVTPVLGTPSSGTLTSCTGLPLSTGVTGTLPQANGGTGITTASNGITVSDLIFIIDGGGSAITTGTKGYIEVPFACTVNQWTLLADTSGSISVDVYSDAYASYGTNTSMVGGGTKPTITSATKAQSAPSGWTTTSIAAGNIIGFNVASVATCTRVTVALKVTRT